MLMYIIIFIIGIIVGIIGERQYQEAWCKSYCSRARKKGNVNERKIN